MENADALSSKTCTSCGQLKPLSHFAQIQLASGELTRRDICDECGQHSAAHDYAEDPGITETNPLLTPEEEIELTEDQAAAERDALRQAQEQGKEEVDKPSASEADPERHNLPKGDTAKNEKSGIPGFLERMFKLIPSELVNRQATNTQDASTAPTGNREHTPGKEQSPEQARQQQQETETKALDGLEDSARLSRGDTEGKNAKIAKAGGQVLANQLRLGITQDRASMKIPTAPSTNSEASLLTNNSLLNTTANTSETSTSNNPVNNQTSSSDNTSQLANNFGSPITNHHTNLPAGATPTAAATTATNNSFTQNMAGNMQNTIAAAEHTQQAQQADARSVTALFQQQAKAPTGEATPQNNASEAAASSMRFSAKYGPGTSSQN